MEFFHRMGFFHHKMIQNALEGMDLPGYFFVRGLYVVYGWFVCNLCVVCGLQMVCGCLCVILWGLRVADGLCVICVWRVVCGWFAGVCLCVIL